MKDRLLTLTLAVAAFALFYALFVPPQRPQHEGATRPLSTEAGPNGYLALQRWLESQGIAPLSLRRRYTSLLSNAGGSAQGNLLISTAPHLLPMRSSEVASLQRWIANGNTLLVLAGLADTPDWSMGEGLDPAVLEHLASMTGLQFVQVGGAANQAQDASAADEKASADSPAQREARTPRSAVAGTGRLAVPARHELVPNGEHPLLEGVHSVAALSEYPSEQFRASSAVTNVVLELAHDRAADEPVLWLARRGGGQIIVCGFGSVFTNKLLAQADNARLLANIVSSSLRKPGRVIIDDAHQGAVEFYDPAAFYDDTRLHQTLLWLVALWLVFVLGPQRLRAKASTWHPVDITTFVHATGGFLARVVKPAAAAQQLFDNFIADIARSTGRTADELLLWEWLRSYSAVSAADVSKLRELHERMRRGRRVNLSQLHNLLTCVRRAMT